MNENSLSQLFNLEAFPPDAFYLEKVLKGRKIIVYGAGESFHYFKEVVIRQYGYRPSMLLDRKFAPGDRFEDIPACSPADYHPTLEEQKDAIVVVCLGNQNYCRGILHLLRQMGFCRILWLRDIYEIHNPFRLPGELEETGFAYYKNQREQIESCWSLFADDISRNVFACCLQTHLQRKPVTIPMQDRQEQYTPKDIRMVRGYSHLVYCGVSVGEMADLFRRVGRVEELVCFEPDPNQFRLVSQFLRDKHETIAHRVTAIPCAVYNREGIEPFSYSETSFGSRILSTGEARIQTVALDHVLPGLRPSMILMDIEGAELEALDGAEQTIRQSAPDLAVCVYHSPSHLWEIPLYLHGLGIGYRFFLRNYTSFVGETVLYATV